MNTFNKKACEDVIQTIRDLQVHLTKSAFLPFPGDMPPGAQGGQPQAAPQAPPGPPQGDPSQMAAGAPPQDPSQGMPPGGDPSQGAPGAGAPPPGGDPQGAPQAGGAPAGDDHMSQAIESVLEGLQQLAETVQQLGAEFDKRISEVELMGSKLEQAQKKQSQDMDQLATAHEESSNSIQEIMPFIQSMQQPAPMDGSVGGQGGGGQQMDQGGMQGGDPLMQGMTPDATGGAQDGLGQQQGDPMAAGGLPPQGAQGMPQVQ